MLPASLSKCLHGSLQATQAASRLAQQARRALSSSMAASQQSNPGTSDSSGAQAGQLQQGQQGQSQQQQEHIVIPIMEYYDRNHNNTFYLTGNVTRHPVLNLDRLGRAWADLELAKNSRTRTKGGGKEEGPPEYYTFKARGALAQAVVNQVRLGQKVTVEAHVHMQQPAPAPVEPGQPRAPRTYNFVLRNLALIARPQPGFTSQRQTNDMSASDVHSVASSQ